MCQDATPTSLRDQPGLGLVRIGETRHRDRRDFSRNRQKNSTTQSPRKTRKQSSIFAAGLKKIFAGSLKTVVLL